MATRAGVRAVAIVAFDGVIADTLPLRAAALQGALIAFAGPSSAFGSIESISKVVETRTFAESARATLAARDRGRLLTGAAAAAATEGMTAPDETNDDETTVDLVAVDAARRYSSALTHGASLVQGAESWLAELGRTHRIAARADSSRRDVNTIVMLASLEHAFFFVRCSDDSPRIPLRSSLDGSWAAIDVRLTSNGILPEQRHAFEGAPRAFDSARPFVASVRAPTFQHAITEDRAERE